MKERKESNHATKLYMTAVLALALLLPSLKGKAQDIYPFQGGAAIMDRFFKDSLTVSPEIIQAKATGTAIFKFTADMQGAVNKIIILYADDYLLTAPLIEALRKSTHKWIIPEKQKTHDFIITFSVNYSIPTEATAALKKDIYHYYASRRPILTTNQVPLDNATLLPTVAVLYDLQ